MKRFAYLSDEASVETFMSQQVLTPGLYSGRFLEPIKVRNCWYFISSEIPGRGAPTAPA